MYTYSINVSLVGVNIATKIATAENAYDACGLMEQYMRQPSQYDAKLIEKLRSQYKLADLWFDYEARCVERGVYEDTTVNEHAVVIGGEIVSWARDWGVAENRYQDEIARSTRARP